ncbi:MAG: Urea carboxylase [Frankiales bacterium]|nr:Urea carboxylase [Frankiales bacterium]
MTAMALRTATVRVVEPGLQTTVQELPGRQGLWDVGVPPSGAWDDLSFALANLAVGNDRRAAGIEAVMTGPTLVFSQRSLICLAGAVSEARLDGAPVRAGIVTVVPAGGVLEMGTLHRPGMRGYLCVAGGVDVPLALGSRATFLLGKIGGYDGRALAAGDELPLGSPENTAAPLDVLPLLPEATGSWVLRVLPGPHGAPEHLTEQGVHDLFATSWVVDHRADRTGIRLLGPRPGWARTDGGEAGLHPSNIHDSAYPVGGIMLSGDTPVIVGPDGPSLGGFVVPCAVVRADLWKLGQLRPGDEVQLVPIAPDEADRAWAQRQQLLADPRAALAARLDQSLLGDPVEPPPTSLATGSRPELLAALEADGHRPAMTVRRAGDCHLLVECGPPLLDLSVRVWVHLLADALRSSGVDGVEELVEGVRSMLVKVDASRLPLPVLADLLRTLALQVPDPDDVVLDVREVTLPLCFDHELAHEAMARYARSVRPDAPWCPDNVEFIRRINDLGSRDEVFDIVRDATYLVVGLGDVYLGAPVAVPIDPRHRLVTTKYDPARTWTPQNAVGIGGIYLCIYGMEGPGGYQLVGRTVPVWRHVLGSDEKPWLLRPFDRLRFVPVTADELAEHRRDVKAGAPLTTRPATFRLSEIAALEATHADEIDTTRARRRSAFAAERERWSR